MTVPGGAFSIHPYVEHVIVEDETGECVNAEMTVEFLDQAATAILEQASSGWQPGGDY
jgi:hypothetical protein